MGKSRFTETQIVQTLKVVGLGHHVKDVCRELGISEATYYQRKSNYGGMEASDFKRVKELELENSKLKRMYAELTLDDAVMRDLIANEFKGSAQTYGQERPTRVPFRLRRSPIEATARAAEP